MRCGALCYLLVYKCILCVHLCVCMFDYAWGLVSEFLACACVCVCVYVWVAGVFVFCAACMCACACERVRVFVCA